MRHLYAAGSGARLAVDAREVVQGLRVGESVAVSGVCLTVVRADARGFEAEVSPETLRCTILGDLRPGEPVNLERALRLSDRLGGHVVTGHVDGVGRIATRRQEGNTHVLTVAVPENLRRYLIPKGSVAVDGVSLTVNAVLPEGFSVAIIPHTARLTTLGHKRAGDRVNLEMDLIGKYLERLLEAYVPLQPRNP